MRHAHRFCARACWSVRTRTADRFPRGLIAHAVWLDLRYALSFRDVEELLAERGVQVRYETVRRWVAKFDLRYADKLRRREMRAGQTWNRDDLDETAVRADGVLRWLWRAVEEHGQNLDVLPQEQRDTNAAEWFFRRLLVVANITAPERITTRQAGERRRGTDAARGAQGCRAPTGTIRHAPSQPGWAGTPSHPPP